MGTLFSVLVWLLSLGLMRQMIVLPLTRLSRVAGRISAGDYKAVAPSGGGNEISLLGDAFNAMAASIDKEISNREGVERELRRTLEELNVLEGLLPICASCKKIREDGGAWRELETYITANSEATFTHAICPDCMQTLYGDILRGKKPS